MRRAESGGLVASIRAKAQRPARRRAGRSGRPTSVGIGGAIFNDSGPLLLIIATFVAACGVLYLRGKPVTTDEAGR